MLAGLGLVSCSNGNDVRHVGGVPATSAKKLEEASEWKRLEAVWQGAKDTGVKTAQTQYIYGNYDGTIDTHGAYLVQEKTLLDDNPETWATTSYRYDENTGLVTEKIDPDNHRTIYAYDDNGFLKYEKTGPAHEVLGIAECGGPP